jgi:sulfate permease, SulP family
MANSDVESVAHRLVPILDWIPRYRREWLLPDVFAGVALWAVMVPEGMAYAGIVGVPPIMGLYTIVPAWVNSAKLQFGQIELLNKGVDDANRIILANPIFQAFGKKRALPTIYAFNKALHLIPPAPHAQES